MASALAMALFLPLIWRSFDVLYVCFAIVLLLAPVCVLLVSAAAARDVRYVLDRDGIASVRHGVPGVRIGWSEIVQVRERPLRGGLEITSGSGSTLRVVRAVDGYQALAEDVLRRARPLHDGADIDAAGEHETSNELVFARSLTPLVVSGIIGPAAPLLSIAFFGGVLFLFDLILLICVTVWFGTWQSARVGSNALVISYLFRTRRIEFNDIARILLGGRKRNDPAGVVIVLADGRSVELTQCKAGALALYSALVHRWSPDDILSRLSEAQ